MRRVRWVIASVLFGIGCGDTERDGEQQTSLTLTGPTSVDSTSPGGDTSASGDAGPGETGADDQDIKFDIGAGADGGADPDGPTTCDQNVDIVFVMDVSTSMGPFLGKLADEILVVDQALQALELPGEPHYGLVVFVDDYALLEGGTPYPDVETLRADFMQWSAFTASNQQVNGGNLNTTWPENSLDALYAAAAGFQWRPADDTLRMIIHTTDDTFWDGPTTGNGIPIQHGYAETVTALQEREIRVFSFAAQIGGMCECENVTPGWSSPYMGMDPIPQATGGGVFDIDAVLADQISLSEGINGAVEDTMCQPYPPVG